MTNATAAKANMTKTCMTTAAAALLALSLWSGAALALGAGGGGGGGGAAFSGGVPNPYKYYPICPRGRAGVDCQCRIGGSEEANVLCRPGEHCDTRSGTCAAAAPGRTGGQ